MGVWPLRVVGTISYSLFLIHPFYLLVNFPQLVFARVGGAQPFFEPNAVAPWWYGFFLFLPGMLLWSAISYIVIKRPFKRMRPKQARSRGGVAEGRTRGGAAGRLGVWVEVGIE
jgi:peptidoglycan/LPS O-acetylase OafA/YrhL